ncbi:MAG TPA: alcohol dehydrogenase catalytic domain-containing protein [Acidimicrobiia bacterium]
MSVSSARAMLLVEPQHLSSTRLPVAPMSQGGWLAIEATGLSGVDVQAWQGSSPAFIYPLIPGHEVVGRIVEAVDDHWGVEVGNRVVVESSIRCGACRRCTNGMSGCSYRQPVNAYGMLPSTEMPAFWGGLAELLYLDPGARLHVVSDGIPAVVATFAHPLAAGFTWAVEIPNLEPGENVLILGPGPRGLSSLIAAKQAGAGWVGVAGLPHDTDRLKLASELGADLVTTADQNDLEQAVADSLGSRPDVVVDVTSDDPDAIHTALDLVRAGGRMVLASTKGARAINQLFSDIVVLKELTIRGAFGASSAGYHWATRQLAADDRLDQMVSHEFPLEEAAKAIQAAAGLLGRDDLISVAVTS